MVQAKAVSSSTKRDMRGLIRNAALLLFAERGFDATSIGEVSKAAGVPKANVLYYFSDKEELWKEAINHHWAEVDAFYAEQLPDTLEVNAAGLRELLMIYLEACCRFPPHVQIMNLEGHSASWRNEWLAQRHLKRHYEQGRPYLNSLIEAGVIRTTNPLVLQSLITGGAQLLIGQFQLWKETTGIDPRESTFRESYANAVVDHIMR